MSDVSESFWDVIVGHLKATFESISSLNESRAVRGQIWIAEVDDLARRGEPRRLGTRGDLSWPVLGPDGKTVYALRGPRVVRFQEDGATETAIGEEASWRKLLGVGPDGTVLGFVTGGPFGRPATMSADGGLSVAAPPQTAEERKRHAVLLADSRAYADGRRLVIRSSQRGGRGLDVFIEREGQPPTNLSDCGDDLCGQPSLAPDGRHVLWIRSSGS